MANEIPQTPLTTPPPSFYPERENKKPKKRLAKIIFGVIVIILLGTGISLAARIWDPLWNPFRPGPEKVITKMSQKMEEVKTLHSEIKLDFGYDIKSETSEELRKFTMVMTIKGDSDGTDPQTLKSAGNFDIISSFDGMQISMAGENITIGQDNYLKFNTIPFPLSTMLGEAQGQWIKYDEESYLKSVLGEVPPEMAEEREKAKEGQKEIIKKFEAILKDKKLYLVKKEFPDEDIRDVKTYHYLADLNKEEIKKLLPELFKATVDYISPAMPLGEGVFEEISPKLDEFFGKIGEITAEIWIGKTDNHPYKIKAEKEIDMSQFTQIAKGKIIIKADIDFSKFNQPVKIEAPKDFKTLEEILPEEILK